MAKKSYSESISQARVMIDGLTGNKGNLPKGMDEAFLTSLTDSCAKVVSLNSEQEKLKADLKSKTAELDAEVAAMMKLYSEAKKRVKMDFPQEQWKEFGKRQTITYTVCEQPKQRAPTQMSDALRLKI